ncbi:hypothetical protein Tco_1311185 [Tanacetum coccineum]
MEAHLAPTQPTQVNKVTTSCEICSGPHDTQYCMEDPEQAYVDYASSCTNKIGGNSMTPKSIATISHVEREELRKKGIKSPSKLFTLKYLSPASIKELNKNLSAPKRVHFVNSIVILSKDSDMEEDVSSTNACRHDLGKIKRGNEEVNKQGREEDEMEIDVEVEEVIEEEESEFETDEEVEEILKEEEEDEDDENFNSFPTMKELSHHEWLLKNPRPLQDGGDRRGVRHLMRLEKEMMDDKGEVTLYSMRRSLEVIRKFHWMILGGQFNQLSHVSSPLLRKPGEY